MQWQNTGVCSVHPSPTRPGADTCSCLPRNNYLPVYCACASINHVTQSTERTEREEGGLTAAERERRRKTSCSPSLCARFCLGRRVSLRSIHSPPSCHGPQCFAVQSELRALGSAPSRTNTQQTEVAASPHTEGQLYSRLSPSGGGLHISNMERVTSGSRH